MTQEPTIRRGVRNGRYAAIPNHVFEDTRLSMEARWLLGYLLSKPDNWSIMVGDIIKKGNCGRDKGRKMIAELVEHGYAEREEQNRENGKFSNANLVIYDEPREGVTFLPQTCLPATAAPSTVPPSPVKSAHSNNSDLLITENSNLREGVREREEDQIEPEARRKIEDAFWRVVKGWPDALGMPKDEWLRQWMLLTPEERVDAEKLRDAWLALLGAKRKHIPVPKTYFREKLWKEVPALQEAAKPSAVVAPPFGKLWGGTRLADLAAGPTGRISPVTPLEKNLIERGSTTLDQVVAEKRLKMGWPSVNRMHERARDGRGELCPLALEAAVASFHAVHREGALYAAWKAEHVRRGWPFLDDSRPMERVYFPAIGEGRTDYEAAVCDALDGFLDGISDFLKARRQGDDHAA
ncbi:hypothetical protein [Rhizobium sp. 9140]|uniref:hypothetical protein n=1 Tax=Rhizobium sp. 9140 TaxID=1761900 RepID=UPI00079C54CA|nr:hypothetical protein [Rhizobium sp. 9140]CZT36151.1 hypothetical protein GA0004734_00031530 [Rhizobium sp. 9140]